MYKVKLCKHGKIFNSSEALYQYEKSIFHNRHDIAIKIINSKNGYDEKRIAKQIQENSSWNCVKVEKMRQVLKVKFQQCSDFQSVLKTHKGKLFVETTFDKFWGAGSKNITLSTFKR